MGIHQPRYSKDEHARRGQEMYERQVRPQVEAGNHGRIVAVEIDTGAYELGDDTLTACERLLARIPDAQIWCVRIGYPAVHRFGPRVRPAARPTARTPAPSTCRTSLRAVVAVW